MKAKLALYRITRCHVPNLIIQLLHRRFIIITRYLVIETPVYGVSGLGAKRLSRPSMNSKQKHSQRGIQRGYKVDAVVKKKKGWIDPGPDWKPKPVKRKTLVGKLDEIVSLIIRDRDKRCVLCGSTDRLTNGHVLPGKYLVLRFDIRLDGNCHTQCWPCNYKHVNHQAPYYNWFINKFGLERWNELNREYYGQDRKHYSDKELRELYESLKAQYGHLLHANKSK